MQNKANRFNSKRKSRESCQDDDAKDDPILREFRAYSLELDDKHDRHERIVKISRDITIESKRIIFLLHTIDGKKNHKQVLIEAEQRLNKLIQKSFSQIAKELHGTDPLQYRWAYSPGLQEFIEAYSFMEYLSSSMAEGTETKSMSDWKTLQAKMRYKDGAEIVEPITAPADEAEAVVSPETKPNTTVKKVTHEFLVDPTEFILGIADLTGELMRRCINSLGTHNTQVCIESCRVLQKFYTGYIGLHVPRCRELSRKIHTMRQSVLKTENACYNVKVRGGEAAVWGSTFEKPTEDVDEGFY